MAIALVQQSAIDIAVDVDITPRNIVLPANAAAGGAILVFVSGWNFDEQGAVTAACIDDGSNTYTKLGSFTNGARGRAEMWLAVNVAAADTITITPATNNGSNRLSTIVTEWTGVDAAPLDQVDGGAAGLNTTSLAVSTGATTTDEQVVIAGLSTLWVDTPKNAALSGYTTIASVQDTPADQMGMLLSHKLVSSAGVQSANWTFNLQSQGAQGIIATLKAGSAIGYKVRFSGLDPESINAQSCVVQVFRLPTGSNIVDEHLFTLIGQAIADDGTGKGELLIDVPGGVSVSAAQSVRAVVRGITGGQLWGTHAIIGTVEAIT